jgi:hypothetical protein
MGLKFAEIAFTPTVKHVQEQLGSRRSYARMEAGEAMRNHVLGPSEAGFIGERDSFYMASVSETGLALYSAPRWTKGLRARSGRKDNRFLGLPRQSAICQCRQPPDQRPRLAVLHGLSEPYTPEVARSGKADRRE